MKNSDNFKLLHGQLIIHNGKTTQIFSNTTPTARKEGQAAENSIKNPGKKCKKLLKTC